MHVTFHPHETRPNNLVFRFCAKKGVDSTLIADQTGPVCEFETDEMFDPTPILVKLCAELEATKKSHIHVNLGSHDFYTDRTLAAGLCDCLFTVQLANILGF